MQLQEKTTEKMEPIIEAEIDFGFQFGAERFILALKLLRADAQSGAARLPYVPAAN